MGGGRHEGGGASDADRVGAQPIGWEEHADEDGTPYYYNNPNSNPDLNPNPNPTPKPKPEPEPNQARPTTTTLRVARPHGSGRSTTTNRPSQRGPSPALPPPPQGRRPMPYRGGTRLGEGDRHHSRGGAWVVGRRRFRGAWVDLHRSPAAKQLPWASAGCWHPARFEGAIGQGTTEVAEVATRVRSYHVSSGPCSGEPWPICVDIYIYIIAIARFAVPGIQSSG